MEFVTSFEAHHFLTQFPWENTVYRRECVHGSHFVVFCCGLAQDYIADTGQSYGYLSANEASNPEECGLIHDINPEELEKCKVKQNFEHVLV